MKKSSTLTGAVALALLSFCNGCSSNSNSAGANEPDSNPWAGHAYLLNIPSSHWAEPRNAGADIGAYVPAFLLAVNAVSGSTADVLVGTANSVGIQDLCNPTTLTHATSNYPSITIGPATIPLRIEDSAHNLTVNAKAYDLTMTDVLPGTSDASASGGEFVAYVDTREIYRLFYLLGTPTPDIVCTALNNTANAPCTACQDGSLYCVKLRATQLSASELKDVSVQSVDATQLDPSCMPDAGADAG